MFITSALVLTVLMLAAESMSTLNPVIALDHQLTSHDRLLRIEVHPIRTLGFRIHLVHSRAIRCGVHWRCCQVSLLVRSIASLSNANV